MASKKKETSTNRPARREVIREEIIALLTELSPRLLKGNELSKHLGIAAESPEHEIVREVLEELQEQNIIYKGPRRRFGRVIPNTAIEGVLKMIDSGRWELIPEDGSRPVLKFDREEIWTAFDGDIVKARPLSAASPGDIPWGEVTRVIERKTDRFVGVIRQGRGLYLQPDSRKVHRTISIPQKQLSGAVLGDKVVVELMKWDDPEAEPTGKVVRKIGRAGEMNAEIASLVEEFDVHVEFPDDVIAEAESFSSELRPIDLKDRRDLRDQNIVTIDPYDARDFDDAISIRTLDDGDVVLGVHIADVSHYVTEGSALDREAFERGTSIYLVTGVVPMLPERLSNGLCSLRPDEDRLAYTVEVRLSPRGAIRDYEIFRSVIRSKRRFTYEEALDVLETGKGEYAEDLLAINKIVLALRRNRQRMGSVDFSTTELKFRLDDEGKPVEVVPKRATESTKMIEDCMLLANRVVAEHIGMFRFLDRKTRGGDLNPFIYRIHDVPPKDKLIDLSNFVKQFNYSLPVDNIKPKDIQKLLEWAKKSGYEQVITEVTLRSMAKAVYSEHNVGHFGLAFPWYTHFTSPIRRYPDLIVHRLLNEYAEGMSGKRLKQVAERIGSIADHSSARERVAVDAERRSIKIAEVEFLSHHVGDIYKATIISILPFGMFTELADLGIQGLIPVRSLKDDYYKFDDRRRELIGRNSRRHFRIGDRVHVRVMKVDEVNREIDLGLIDEDEYNREMKGEGKGIRRPIKGEPPQEARPAPRYTRRKPTQVKENEERDYHSKKGKKAKGKGKTSDKKSKRKGSTGSKPKKRKK